MSSDSADTVDGAAVEPDLDTLVQRLMRVIELGLRVSAPARIVMFDPITCKATVRLELLRIQDVRGEAVPDIPTLLSLVPVKYERASLGGTTIPLVPGDTGRVVFNDRALAAWLQNGNPVAPVDPESGRAHNLADAVFEPGLLTDADAITAGPIDMTATVVDGAALVKLGANAAQPVIRGTAFLTALSTFLTAVAGESVIHPNTAAAATALNGLIAGGTLASAKVLTE